jgi:hypothetical protein
MKINASTTWCPALIASGIAMMIGAPRHPDADAEDSLRHELATMTADHDWVFAHSFIVLSSALLATGLWLAHRSRTWPTSTLRALYIAAIAVAAYTVETVFHLAAKVDTDALRDGDAAPVAFTHVGLAIVLYPVSGFAVAWLAATLFRAVGRLRKPIAVAGIVGGVMHACSVPLTVAFPDNEFTPLFAGSATLLALWSIAMGVFGLGDAARVPSDRLGDDTNVIGAAGAERPQPSGVTS